jgi:hypothetical protein
MVSPSVLGSFDFVQHDRVQRSDSSKSVQQGSLGETRQVNWGTGWDMNSIARKL